MAAVNLLPVPNPGNDSNLRTIWENFKKIRNHFPYFNVKDYGANAPGVTDNATAFRLAAAALQAAGGGTLVIPPGSYSAWGSTTGSNEVLFDFTDLTGIRVIADGATIQNTRTWSGTDKGAVFRFTGCRHFSIDSLNVDTTQTLPTTASTNKNFGVDIVALYSDVANGGCYGTRIGQLKARGCRAVFAAYADVDDDEYMMSRGIDIDIIDTDTCVYGANLQFSGDDIRIGLIRSKKPHRSFFPYGIKNFSVRIVSNGNDADDCFLRSYNGAKLRNGEIEYYNIENSDSPKAQSAAPGISFAYTWDAVRGPGTIDNIRIKTNQRWDDWGGAAAGNPAAGFHGAGIHIYKYAADDSTYDTVRRGHVLSNITIEGVFEGNPSGATGNSPPITVNGNWTGVASEDVFNFTLRNLWLNGTASATLTFLDSLIGPARLENVYSDANIYLGENPSGTRITCVNCKVPNLTAATTNTGYHDYYGCIFTDGTLQSIINKRFDGRCMKAGYLQPNAQEVAGLYSTTNTSLAKFFASDAAGGSPVDTDNVSFDGRVSAGSGAVVRNTALLTVQSAHSTNHADNQIILSSANSSNNQNAGIALLQNGSLSLRLRAATGSALATATLLATEVANFTTTIFTTALQAIFTKTGGGPAAGVIVSAAAPAIALEQTGGAANNKFWDFIATSEQLQGRAIDDANSASGKWVYVDRTGTTIDEVYFPARVSNNRGANVASANDLTLGKDGNSFGITGTTNLNGIATANWHSGAVVKLFLLGAITVKHNTAPSAGFAKFNLQGAADFVGASGDVLTVEYDGTYWQETARRTA